MNKTLDAENVMLLRHLLDMEIRRIRQSTGVDLIMFSGVDGRVFSSDIPKDLTVPQFRMLNLTKSMMPHIARQLDHQNLSFSIQKFKEGGVIVSGVGDNAFLTLVVAKDMPVEDFYEMIPRVLTGSSVLRHIFELKPISPERMSEYPEDVQEELKVLSRRLFVERFEETREYKKNMEILNFIKKKLESVVGIGAVDEIVSMVFNEMGTSAPYMNQRLWMMFVEKVIKEHVKERQGEIVADEMEKTWLPEVERKIKSFV